MFNSMYYFLFICNCKIYCNFWVKMLKNKSHSSIYFSWVLIIFVFVGLILAIGFLSEVHLEFHTVLIQMQHFQRANPQLLAQRPANHMTHHRLSPVLMKSLCHSPRGKGPSHLFPFMPG